MATLCAPPRAPTGVYPDQGKWIYRYLPVPQLVLPVQYRKLNEEARRQDGRPELHHRRRFHRLQRQARTQIHRRCRHGDRRRRRLAGRRKPTSPRRSRRSAASAGPGRPQHQSTTAASSPCSCASAASRRRSPTPATPWSGAILGALQGQGHRRHRLVHLHLVRPASDRAELDRLLAPAHRQGGPGSRPLRDLGLRRGQRPRDGARNAASLERKDVADAFLTVKDMDTISGTVSFRAQDLPTPTAPNR